MTKFQITLYIPGSNPNSTNSEQYLTSIPKITTKNALGSASAAAIGGQLAAQSYERAQQGCSIAYSEGL